MLLPTIQPLLPVLRGLTGSKPGQSFQVCARSTDTVAATLSGLRASQLPLLLMMELTMTAVLLQANEVDFGLQYC